MKNYSALIIDLKKSRLYSNDERNLIQNYIILAIPCLNTVFSQSIARQVEFSAGDEVQGLFTSPEAAYLYFRMFSMLVAPVEIRAGIGIGEWSVKIEHASTSAQDGPVYHNARFAIEKVKDALGYCVLLYSEGQNDIFVNAAINTPFMLTNNHSDYQNELMLLSELLYPIDLDQLIDVSKISEIFKLVEAKNKLNYYQNYKKSGAARKYPFDTIAEIDLEFHPVDAARDDSSLYISSGKRRGMATQLSQMLNISRQSIEKTIKTANINEARNATIVALKFMNQCYCSCVIVTNQYL